MKKNALPYCRGNEQDQETCSDNSLTSEGNLASLATLTWRIGSDSETDEINRNEDESGNFCESNKCSEMTESMFVEVPSLSTHAKLVQRRHTLHAKRNSSFEGCAPGRKTHLGSNGASVPISLHSSVTRSASFDQNSRCGGYRWLLLKVILVKIPAMHFSVFHASSTCTESKC